MANEGLGGDQFQQYNDFNQSLGGHMGSFASAMVEADAQSKDLQVLRLRKMLEGDNVEANVAVKVPQGEMTLDVSVPPIVFASLEPLVTDKAFMTMDMEVRASTSDSLKASASAEASGSASVGFAFFKASASFKASSSVSKEQARKTDNMAKTHAELTMVQGTTPEGVMIISDAINDIVKAGAELSKRDALNKAEAMAGTPAPEGDSGGSGGGESEG